jgi:hypothetical protein
MQEMWDKLFTPDLVFWMKQETGDTEDFDTVGAFIEHVKARVDYKQIVILSTQWHGMDEKRQVNISITFAGVFHASRFILTMDYLSKKFLEGKLK